MVLDIDQLFEDLKNVASEIISKDVTTVRGFSTRQLKGIATQSALVASGIASNQISESLRPFVLDQIIELTQNFVNTLVGLLLVTIERLWNALVNFIWGAISKATGVSLEPFKPL